MKINKKLSQSIASVVVDSKFILNDNLTAVDMRLYLLIKSQCIQDDIFITKTAYLSDTLNVGQRIVQKSLKKLEQAGYIATEQEFPFYKIFTT